MDPALRRRVHYAAKTSKKLARRMFHAMLRHGPKLEREQMLLSRFVTVGTELFAQVASATRAQALLDAGRDRKELLELVEHFCETSRLRIDEAFRQMRGARAADVKGYRLAQDILAGSVPWLVDGIVDSDLEVSLPRDTHAGDDDVTAPDPRQDRNRTVA